MSIYEKAGKHGVDYRDEFGRRRRQLIGSKAAATALDTQLHQSAREARAAMQHMTTATNLAVSDAVEIYLSTIRTGPRRREEVTMQLQRFTKGTGNPTTEQLTPALIEKYTAARALRIAPSSAAHENGTIKQFGQWLAENWYTPGNPAKDIPTKYPKRSAGQPISYEQEAELFAQSFTISTRTKLLLGIDAGLRAGEVLRAKRQDWNREARTLHVWSTKTRTERTIPLTSRLSAQLELIAAKLTPDTHIIRSNQKPTSGTSFLRRRRLRGGQAPRFHDLRHTFASRLAAVAKPHHVRILLGHAPRTTTDLYTHATPEELRSSIDAMEAAHPGQGAEPKTGKEETMPGKRYSFKVKSNAYGPISQARVRPTTDQTGATPGTVRVEAAGTDEAYIVALHDLERIHQPSTQRKAKE